MPIDFRSARLRCYTPSMTLSTERTIVLIVDDDANNLRLLGLILRDAGYEALAVRDPERVLAVIKAKSPEIVLLDVSMPIPVSRTDNTQYSVFSAAEG